MIARRDPGGMVTMPAKPYVVNPAALRRRWRLQAADNVLLAASPGQDTLALGLSVQHTFGGPRGPVSLAANTFILLVGAAMTSGRPDRLR
jgi:hypothetical protein